MSSPPSSERLMAGLLGEVELDDDEKLTVDEAMEAITNLAGSGVTMNEVIAGFKGVGDAAYEAGIPQMIQAELVRRGIGI